MHARDKFSHFKLVFENKTLAKITMKIDPKENRK